MRRANKPQSHTLGRVRKELDNGEMWPIVIGIFVVAVILYALKRYGFATLKWVGIAAFAFVVILIMEESAHGIQSPLASKRSRDAASRGRTSSVQQPSAPSLKVATANTHHGVHYRHLSDCDIIALQECPSNMTSMNGFKLFSGNKEAEFEKMAFLVRNTINVRNHREIQNNFRKRGGRHRNALLIDVSIQGRVLTIANVHLSGGFWDDKRSEMVRENVGRKEIIEGVTSVDIVLGDFNGERDNSENAKRIARDIQQGRGPNYLVTEEQARAWLDGPFKILESKGFESGTHVNTINRYDPVKKTKVQKQVDFIFHNRRLIEQSQEARDIGSDHLALVKTFTIPA